MREVLSLQFGHYSNFIGTHLWNIQETGFDYSGKTKSEINHDVLYREGVTPKGEITYTPRLLLVDLKGSLKTLPEHGNLYDIDLETEAGSSQSGVEVIKQEQFERNSFLDQIEKPVTQLLNHDLSDEVSVWSDYLYGRFHPRSVNIINEYQYDSGEFDTYPLGAVVWRDFSDDFTDKIRLYIEECDSLQGFNLTVDLVDGFGGLGNSCVEYLRDEYDKKTVIVYGAMPAYYPEDSAKNDSIRLLNIALSLSSLSSDSSLVVPVCLGSWGWRQPGPKRNFPHMEYNEQLGYHTSAIIASALETQSLLYRSKNSQYSMHDFCADLNQHGRKLAAASISLPFPISQNEDLIDCLDNWSGPLLQSITPNCEIPSDKLFQVISVRGIPQTRLKHDLIDDIGRRQREMAAYRCESVQEMLTFYLSCMSYATCSHVGAISTPMSIKPPYPKIFPENLGETTSVPVMSGCHSGSMLGFMLEKLHRETLRIKVAKFKQFENSGLEIDTYNETMEQLMDLRECYND